MQLIGFNLNKIKAEKSPNFIRGSINTNIEFTDINKEKLDLLKDNDALKISFIFSITYSYQDKQDKEKDEKENQGEISFYGDMLFSANKEESKDILKAWKKKQILDQFRIPMINFVLKKCSVKALSLEEDLNLPVHIPFPQVQKPQPPPQTLYS